MKQRKIPALVLALILLLGNLCFAGAIAEAVPVPTAAAGLMGALDAAMDAAAPEATAAPGATGLMGALDAAMDAAAPVATAAPDTGAAAPDTGAVMAAQTQAGEAETGKEKAYVLLFDCGYALYGEKSFTNSVVAEPGDADGRIMEFVRLNAPVLLGEDARMLVCGYHSSLAMADAEPVAAGDAQAVEEQFSALAKLKAGDRQSSKPDVAVAELKDALVALTETYDVHLHIFTGGVINYYKDAPDFAAFAADLQALRDAGVNIHAFGLDVAGAGLLKDEAAHAAYALEQYFLEGEYDAAALTEAALEETAAETAAETAETAETAAEEAAAGEALTETEAAPEEIAVDTEAAVPSYEAGRLNMMDAIVGFYLGSETTAVERFDDPAFVQLEAQDLVLSWSYDTVSGRFQSLLQTAEEFRSAADGLRSAGMTGEIFWKLSEIKPEPEYTPEELAAMQAEAQKVTSVNERLGEIRTQLSVEALDVNGREKTFDLTEDFDHNRFLFASSSPETLQVEAAGGKLVVTPLKAGRASVVCTDTATANQIAVEVDIVNSTLDVAVDAQANSVTATSYDGMLSWSVKVTRGADNVLEAAGSSTAFAECPIDGVSWTLSEDKRSVSITASEVGAYSFSFNLMDGNAVEMNSGSQSFTISRPVDALAGPIELIAPYFKEQEGQRIALTSNGAAIDLADYTITAEPAGVINVYHGEDESSLYLVPAAAGTATVMIGEKKVDSAPVSVEVSVVSLASNPMIWVCGAGAVIFLIALTTGVVILIGKGASGRRKD